MLLTACSKLCVVVLVNSILCADNLLMPNIIKLKFQIKNSINEYASIRFIELFLYLID